jgi:lysozyme
MTGNNVIFDTVRPWLDPNGFTPERISALDAAVAERMGQFPTIPSSKPANAAVVGDLTERTVIEIVEHEAIVLEAYKDSVGVWTWSVGITSKSGHDVTGYKDAPQTLAHCLAVYIWLLREKYLPPVLKAFTGHPLTENQLAAAVSFHWNTGAISKTEWVPLFKAGKIAQARQFLLTHYLNGGDLTSRRKAEAALFFDGNWIGDGTVIVWPVKKPSYTPNWSKPQMVDIRAAVKEALAS